MRFDDLMTFTGTLFLLRIHWFWMLVALGLGARVGWRIAGEGDDAPPRSGAGSGVGAWAKHARALGVPVTDDMSRDDIIAAVDAL